MSDMFQSFTEAASRDLAKSLDDLVRKGLDALLGAGFEIEHLRGRLARHAQSRSQHLWHWSVDGEVFLITSESIAPEWLYDLDEKQHRLNVSLRYRFVGRAAHLNQG